VLKRTLAVLVAAPCLMLAGPSIAVGEHHGDHAHKRHQDHSGHHPHKSEGHSAGQGQGEGNGND
jgi:hypothetical protein